MADKLQVTIVGLGLVGASAGLALRQYADKVFVAGHDKDPGVAGTAKKIGAVDRTDWNLIGAVSNADRILLALPPDEIRNVLSAIAEDLKPGCIIVDTADIKLPVLQWAAELLPKEVHLIGGHPILVAENPTTENARADLFQGRLFCLTPDVATDDTAMRLATDLVEAIGAKPFFLDAAEHDGMVAAVEHLPLLMAGALLEATRTSSGWQDMRKLAGGQFYSGTLIMPESGGAAGEACIGNREHLTYWLDQLITILDSWRQRLTAGDEEALTAAFSAGLESRRSWINAQASGNWDDVIPAPELPTSGTFMRSLVGFGWSRPRASGKGKK